MNKNEMIEKLKLKFMNAYNTNRSKLKRGRN